MRMFPRLFTSRLRLREWNAGDLNAIVAIKTEPENWRFIGNGEPKTPEDAARVLGAFQGEWLTRGIGRWAVDEEITGELVGDCGIVLSERGPELAYMINRPKWGLGFATEAAFAVLVYAFSTFEWPTVFASTHPKNTASRRVLEKLGMRHTQTIATPHGKECWYELERHLITER